MNNSDSDGFGVRAKSDSGVAWASTAAVATASDASEFERGVAIYEGDEADSRPTFRVWLGMEVSSQ